MVKRSIHLSHWSKATSLLANKYFVMASIPSRHVFRLIPVTGGNALAK
jgi:hypothetical protein